jgi:AcrR family transcriptional regulator
MDVKSSDKDDSDTNVAADARGASNRNGSIPRKELVRDQLIGIAAELFESKGFDQTSMNDIAQALGLGRSAVYHYFRNKEEILAGLVESESRTPSHELEAIRAAPDLTASEKLRRAIVTGVIRRLSEGSRFNLLSRLEPQIPDELRPLYNKGRRHILDLYVQLIEEGIASGEFRDVNPKIAAFAVIGMANWTSRWFSPEGRMDAEQIGATIADFAIHALAGKEFRGVDKSAVRDIADELRQQVEALDRLLG